MGQLYKYTAEEIENMRTIIKVLYLYDELGRQMTPYETLSITEKMLQTYMSQGLSYSDLSDIHIKRQSD